MRVMWRKGGKSSSVYDGRQFYFTKEMQRWLSCCTRLSRRHEKSFNFLPLPSCKTTESLVNYVPFPRVGEVNRTKNKDKDNEVRWTDKEDDESPRR